MKAFSAGVSAVVNTGKTINEYREVTAVTADPEECIINNGIFR